MVTEYVDTKYNQLDVNNQSFENIEQIIEYLNYPMSFDLNYLRVALENTKKNGYNLQKNVNIENNSIKENDNEINTFVNAIRKMYDRNKGCCCRPLDTNICGSQNIAIDSCSINSNFNTCGSIHNSVTVRNSYNPFTFTLEE